MAQLLSQTSHDFPHVNILETFMAHAAHAAGFLQFDILTVLTCPVQNSLKMRPTLDVKIQTLAARNTRNAQFWVSDAPMRHMWHMWAWVLAFCLAWCVHDLDQFWW